MIDPDIVESVLEQASESHRRFGKESILGPGRTDLERLAVLMEEVGEVATELIYTFEDRLPLDEADITAELRQVAAVCLTWLQDLKRRETE